MTTTAPPRRVVEMRDRETVFSRNDTATPTRRRPAVIVRFAVIGTAGTALQLLMYAVLLQPTGVLLAGVLSWLGSTVLTNLAHQVVTFRVRRRTGAAADQTVAFAACLLALGLTTMVTTHLQTQSTTVQLTALIAVNAVAGAARFAALQLWFSSRGAASSSLSVAYRFAGLRSRLRYAD